jgi:hypothetical protein
MSTASTRIRSGAFMVGRVLPSLLYRHATAPFRVVPSVFILGGTKCGTSTLRFMLWQHPAHVAPATRELMYLQHLPNFRANCEQNRMLAFLWGRYSNGHAAFSTRGYRKFFPTRREMQRRELHTRIAVTSDGDPFNLYCPVAMQRIRDLARAPRFVISLRNPVDRAFSDYNMHRRFDDPRSFEEAVDDELSGREQRFRKRFLNQSLYAPHVEDWLETFPQTSFLILKAEDLFNDAPRIARELFAFLGLPDVPVACEARNVGTYESRMAPALRARLLDYFEPHNRQLYRLLGRDMHWD